MEGFANGGSTGYSTRFVQINDFQFKMQATEEDIEKYPTLVKTRTKTKGVNAGEQVTELCSNKITGMLVGVGRREVNYETETGFEFFIILEDKTGTKFQIQMKDMGRQSQYILTRLPNVDVTKSVDFNVFKSEQEGFNLAQVFFRQDGVTVPNAFPRDGNHEMPSATKVKVGKKDVWDFGTQYDWLVENVALAVAGKISEYQATLPPAAFTAPHPSTQSSSDPAMDEKIPVEKRGKGKKEEEPAGDAIEDDDLPF